MILLTPALQLFTKKYQSAKLHFMLPRNGSREIVECHPQIGEIIETDLSPLSIISIIIRLRSVNAEMVFAANGTNPFKCGLIGIFCRARIRIGELFGAGRVFYNIVVPFDRSLHECAANLRLMSAFTKTYGSPSPAVWTNESDSETARRFIASNQLNGRWFGMHLGSGPSMCYKRWPVERFIETGRILSERFSCKVVLFGGEEETRQAVEAARQIGNDAVAAAGKLNIRQSYEVMKKASLFISNDTGPMHLAAAAGVPVVAVFGPTMDYKTSPVGSRTIVVTAPVSCRPCYKYRPVKCRSLDCLTGVSVDRVVEAALKLIK